MMLSTAGQTPAFAPRVISMTSGKGGVGKSTLTANLALEIARLGKRVLLIDGDFGMANLDVMFGLRARQSLHEVVQGEAIIQDILMPVSENITLIPGGSGIYELQKLTAIGKQTLLDQISQLEESYDVVLVDTAPGITDNVLFLNSAVEEIHVVMTPDPSSLTDAYALIKTLHMKARENRFQVICNQVRDAQDGERIFNRLESVVARFLPVRLELAGIIPMDPHLRQAVRSQQLVGRAQPQSESASAIRALAHELIQRQRIGECKGSLQFFWRQMVGAA